MTHKTVVFQFSTPVITLLRNLHNMAILGIFSFLVWQNWFSILNVKKVSFSSFPQFSQKAEKLENYLRSGTTFHSLVWQFSGYVITNYELLQASWLLAAHKMRKTGKTGKLLAIFLYNLSFTYNLVYKCSPLVVTINSK